MSKYTSQTKPRDSLESFRFRRPFLEDLVTRHLQRTLEGLPAPLVAGRMNLLVNVLNWAQVYGVGKALSHPHLTRADKEMIKVALAGALGVDLGNWRHPLAQDANII